MKNCLREYYWSIPVDVFREKCNEYFSNFCWEVQTTKTEFDNSPNKKMFDPCIWMTWKTKVHLTEVLPKVNLDGENKEQVWEKIPVVLFDDDDFHFTKEFVRGRSPA